MSKRILLIPMSWGRGIGPLVEVLAVAASLKDRDTEPIVLVKDEWRDWVEGAGFESCRLPTRSQRAISEGFFSDFAAFQGLDDLAYVRSIVSAEYEAIDRYRPGAVISVLQMTASISARAAGVLHFSEARWTEASAFSSPVAERHHGTSIAPPSAATPNFNLLLQEHGLATVDDVWQLSFEAADGCFVPSFPEFEPELARACPSARFVGYLEGIEESGATVADWLLEWSRFRGTRIFAYLSAKDITPAEYRSLFRTAFADGDEFAVAVGDRGAGLPTDPWRPSPGISFSTWIDGKFAIANADVVVCGGTRTTVLQALLAGAGIVVLINEGDDELDFIAGRLEQLGLGTVLRGQLSGPALRDAVLEAGTPERKQRARTVGNRMRALGGPSAVANMVLDRLVE